MVRIAVCEDDVKVLDTICQTIDDNLKCEHSTLKFASAEEVLSFVDEYGGSSIDIVVSDIELPGENGIKMSELLKLKYPDMQFVFVTNYTDYIEDVFSVDPVYYILKPVKTEKLIEALEKAVARIAINSEQCLTIMRNTKLVRIKQNEIKYAESDRRTITLHLFGSFVHFNMKLDELEKKLPESFLRIHKSYLVNMNCIGSVSNNKVILLTGEELPVAKAKYTEVKNRVFKYLGDKL